MRTGTNLLWLGGLNQSRVLDAIRRSESVSRVELAERTGLTPQTVSNIVRRLLQDDLVLETGRGSSRGGKPATMLRLNAAAYYAIGMHLDPATTTLVVTDLLGRVVTRIRRRTPSAQGPDRVIGTLVDAVRTIVQRSEVPPDRILGLGVAAPGPIDVGEGSVVTPPNLPGWHTVPLRESLEKATGFAVVIDNDATAATVGERWAGREERSSDMAFVYIGTGVGGGLIFDGQVYRGTSRNAAEIGHISVDPDGAECPCGNRGCLETFLAPHAVAAAIAAYRRVCREARAGDPVAVETVEAAGRRLGHAGITLLNLLDVPRVVLGGWGISHIGAFYSRALATAVTQRAIAHAVRTVEVGVSLIGEDGGAIGAASLVLHRAYSPRLSSL